VLVDVDGKAPGPTERPRDSEPGPAGWTDLIPELDRQSPQGNILVTKQTWRPFASTNIEEQLKVPGVVQIVIAGVATGTGVEATARQSYEQGFNVALAIDVMTYTGLTTTASRRFFCGRAKRARRERSSTG
jgi:nicotinamidase-related amidase